LRRNILICAGVAMALLIAALAIILINRNTVFYRTDDKNAVPNKETAIKIGRVILEEHYGIDKDTELDAVEENGVWKVYNVFERSGVNEDGSWWVVADGGKCVNLRKKDGKILLIDFEG